MGITDKTLKMLSKTVQSAIEKNESKKEEISDVCTSAEKLALQTALHRWLTEKSKKATNYAVKNLIYAPAKIHSLACRWDLMTSMAGAIDRLMDKCQQASNEETRAEDICEESALEDLKVPCEEPAEPENTAQESAEEPETEEAVEAFAETVQPAVEATEEENEDAEEEEAEEEDSSLEGFDLSDLEFVDVMEEPGRYAEMLADEAAGKVRLVDRFRRSFRSRTVQSQGNVQQYYSILKNALLQYKGVKSRISWDYDSFNKGREKIAKINAKTRTLYLYLAIDPSELEDSKYFFDDVSSKKKYAAVPVLFKIKGERKLKQALELIAKICEEKLELPPVKDFEEVDYTEPYRSTKELVQEGLVKQSTAEVPAEVTGEISFF